MPQQRMHCWNCPRYDRAERHCRDGKANPKRKTDSVELAERLGVQALCLYNLHRDAIARCTYFPKHPLTIAATAKRPRRARRGSIVVEEILSPADSGE